MNPIEELPGAELILAGIRDASRGETTAASLLVEIAAPKLRRLGLAIPENFGSPDAELRLYEQLGRSGAVDPYGEYNALLRQLTSFAHALERMP